jgi:hypothetical protein
VRSILDHLGAGTCADCAVCAVHGHVVGSVWATAWWCTKPCQMHCDTARMPKPVCAAYTAGETQSEGGFDKNKVSNAALLDMQETTDQSGKTYYKYELLTRTGAERSKHSAGCQRLAKNRLHAQCLLYAAVCRHKQLSHHVTDGAAGWWPERQTHKHPKRTVVHFTTEGLPLLLLLRS